MSTTITRSTELVTITCPDCAGVYAISEAYKENARQLGGFLKCWTCPYCKSVRGFGEGHHQREKKELEEKARQLENAKNWYKSQMETAEKEREHFRKSRDGWKGQAVKTQKRVAKGVCPCCTRHFPNDKMAAHIATKHPDFGNPQS